MRNAPSSLESVDNALRLPSLPAGRDRARVADVAAELGIALSTDHRLLSTLGLRGFVGQSTDRDCSEGPASDVPVESPEEPEARVAA